MPKHSLHLLGEGDIFYCWYLHLSFLLGPFHHAHDSFCHLLGSKMKYGIPHGFICFFIFGIDFQAFLVSVDGFVVPFQSKQGLCHPPPAFFPSWGNAGTVFCISECLFEATSFAVCHRSIAEQLVSSFSSHAEFETLRVLGPSLTVVSLFQRLVGLLLHVSRFQCFQAGFVHPWRSLPCDVIRHLPRRAPKPLRNAHLLLHLSCFVTF
mmetsp:Transcript_3779/g.23842  ORF Transcript_3779/g.23842 Transcript_3779/m.23842 type:complete len:208 (-) Transcript_3779:43-666(-)